MDSDFEIYDSNEEGTSVYIHSPYNSIYVDYDYIVCVVVMSLLTVYGLKDTQNDCNNTIHLDRGNLRQFKFCYMRF